jgi:serine/threonine protein kinase
LLFNICGTPTEETMPGCTQTGKYSVFEHKPRRLKEHILEQLAKNNLVDGTSEELTTQQVLTDDWFDLVDSLLVYDFKKRLSASQALQHPFFTRPDVVKPCLPSELPLKELEDQHEFITKAERNKKKDFRKEYTFKHNLDWSGQDQASKGGSSLSIINSANREDPKKTYERSYWKPSINKPPSDVIKPVPERKVSETKEEPDWRVSK